MASSQGKVLTLKAVLDLVALTGKNTEIIEILQEYGYITNQANAEMSPLYLWELPVVTGRPIPNEVVFSIMDIGGFDDAIVAVFKRSGYFLYKKEMTPPGMSFSGI